MEVDEKISMGEAEAVPRSSPMLVASLTWSKESPTSICQTSADVIKTLAARTPKF